MKRMFASAFDVHESLTFRDPSDANAHLVAQAARDLTGMRELRGRTVMVASAPDLVSAGASAGLLLRLDLTPRPRGRECATAPGNRRSPARGTRPRRRPAAAATFSATPSHVVARNAQIVAYAGVFRLILILTVIVPVALLFIKRHAAKPEMGIVE